MAVEADHRRQLIGANRNSPSIAGSRPDPPSSEKSPALRTVSSHVLLLPLLTAILIGAVLLSLSVGAVPIRTGVLLRAVWTHNELTATERIILFRVRLPRILSSAIVGSCLSVSGLLFQGLFRNPMADPYVIGASGGSVLGASLGIFLFAETSFFGLSLTALLAFAGSALTMVVIYSLARARGRTNVVTLLLAGFAVSTILANCTYIFEVLDTASGSGTRILLSWLRGVISTPPWTELTFAATALFIGVVLAGPLTRRLNTLALGDDYAHQLGLNVEHTRIAIILVGSLLTSVAVALGGLISFAGLIIPNISRLLLGPDNTRLLPVSVLAGAIFLVLADTLARTVLSPTEIPVGVLMALVGGPFFLYLLRRPRRELSL